MTESPQGTAPKPGSNAPLIIVLLLVIGGAGAWYFVGGAQYKMMEAEGTVTYMDYAKRSADLEMPDPKGGTPMSVSGEIGDDCVITVGGKAGSVNDIRVGDRVKVKAKFEKRKKADGSKEKHFTAVSVEVLRQES
ncbi:MAG: hypothetical protein H6819_05615 [Phycisphaerales bacterium]|nr:hypothetical protein [Phycisphaerales bacterium]MCB9854742.1 hypothetical protein [Phycisphaerales bacterium]